VRVPKTVCLRVPIDACGNPIAVGMPVVSGAPITSAPSQPTPAPKNGQNGEAANGDANKAPEIPPGTKVPGPGDEE
jgi:hypothetical protein